MASETWPASLPQNMLMDGYSHSAANNILRTNMDAGPAKQRRRFTSGPQPVTGKIFVNDTELETFKDWYVDDLLEGALRFDWVDQDDGTTAVEYRFTSQPTWEPAGPGYWFINLPLEIMP